MSDTQITACPTYEEMLKQLLLPNGIRELLAAPLDYLRLPLVRAAGDDALGNVFSYYQARAAEQRFAFIYVANIQDKSCASVVQNVGQLFFSRAERLLVFSGVEFMFPGYRNLIKVWQKRGLEVEFFAKYDIDLFDVEKQLQTERQQIEREGKSASQLAEEEQQLRQQLETVVRERVIEQIGLAGMLNGKPTPSPGDSTGVKPEPPPQRVQIFVSYSHEDKSYLDRGELIEFIRGTIKSADIWTDRAIDGGDLFDDVIQTAITRSHIAVLLISQAFLNSKYVAENELPKFLERAESEGVVVFPVMLSACQWPKHDWLKKRNFLPAEGQNVEQHYKDKGDRKALYTKICEDLEDQINKLHKLTQSDK